MRSRHLSFFISIAAVLAVTPFALTASAQSNTWNGNKINGVPASVTSFGFGGRPGFHGVPPSVTSLNFGHVPNAGTFHHPHGFGGGGHRHNFGCWLFCNPGGPQFIAVLTYGGFQRLQFTAHFLGCIRSTPI